jgi:multidrug resistance efflux pump
MRTWRCLFVLLVAVPGLGCGPGAAVPDATPAHAAEGRADADAGWVAGKTQPAAGHVAVIAPAVLHPVEEVLVRVGDRVKKGQPLVKLDDDEPQADVRGKRAALDELRAGLARLKAEPRQEEQDEAEATLENCRAATRASRELLERLEPLWNKGSIPEQRYHEARSALSRCQAEERAAAARLGRLRKRPFELEVAELEARVAAAAEAVKSAEAELEHYTVTAAIDGVVASLEVSPGTVSRPGTTVWGEVLDRSVLDVRCDLTPQQADRVAVGQAAEVAQEGRPDAPWKGKVTVVGIAADPRSGRVPVLVQVSDGEKPPRCYVEVKVRFAGGPTPRPDRP